MLSAKQEATMAVYFDLIHKDTVSRTELILGDEGNSTVSKHFDLDTATTAKARSATDGTQAGSRRWGQPIGPRG
jgi:hypothetical protein